MEDQGTLFPSKEPILMPHQWAALFIDGSSDDENRAVREFTRFDHGPAYVQTLLRRNRNVTLENIDAIFRRVNLAWKRYKAKIVQQKSCEPDDYMLIRADSSH